MVLSDVKHDNWLFQKCNAYTTSTILHNTDDQEPTCPHERPRQPTDGKKTKTQVEHRVLKPWYTRHNFWGIANPCCGWMC